MVLLSGLSAALRVFTICMAVVAVFLRTKGVHVFLYLNDWLVKSLSRAQVEAGFHLIQLTFSALGLLLNIWKSTFIPVQRIEFIGVVFDSVQVRALFPDDKIPPGSSSNPCKTV